MASTAPSGESQPSQLCRRSQSPWRSFTVMDISLTSCWISSPPITQTHPRCTESPGSTRRAYQWDPLSQPSVLQHTAWLRSLPGFWPPLTGKNSYTVKDSTQFVTNLQDVHISTNDQFVSFNVVSLLTQVPINHDLNVVERGLSDNRTLTERTTIPVQQLVQFTELCLRSTCFKCQSKLYKQTDGAAMCPPFSHHCKSVHGTPRRRSHPISPIPTCSLNCYVDDTFVIWQHGEEELARFHQHLNQQSPTIQFTMEREKEGRIAFLDVLVSKDGDRLSTTVYRKPTHTDRYIPFHNHHHPRVLTGVMQGMWNRALQVCDDTSRPVEMQHLEEVSTANGFPEQLMKKTLSRPPKNSEEDDQPEERPTILCTPYIHGTSEKLERVCAPLWGQGCVQTTKDQEKLLVQVKKKVPPWEPARSSVWSAMQRLWTRVHWWD